MFVFYYRLLALSKLLLQYTRGAIYYYTGYGINIRIVEKNDEVLLSSNKGFITKKNKNKLVGCQHII